MDHGDGHGMGMGMMSSPSSSSSSTMNMPRKHMMMMHMSFYWGHTAEILFKGWPGSSTGMYVLSLFFVFILAVLVEWLSRSHLIGSRVKNAVVSGLLRTLLHSLRMTLAYFVMLATMSFNVGVFIVAIAGHGFGFFLFGSRVFGSGASVDGDGKTSDLPPMSC